MKWKGATLLGEEGEREVPSNPADGGTPDQQDDALATPDADDSSLAATAGTTLSTATPTTERELFDLNASCGTDSEGNQVTPTHPQGTSPRAHLNSSLDKRNSLLPMLCISC